uniref:PKD_channel domain-containing protein n=1 Tax=Macrostomum lignano TaxID=282301 RepID=A0A1I8JQX7_9PLAT
MLAELGRFSHNQLLELVCALFPSRSREDLDQVVSKMLPKEPASGGKRPARAGDEAAAQEAEERTQLMLEKSMKFRSAMLAAQKAAGELKAIPSSYNSESLTPIDGSYDRSSSSGQRPSNSRGNDLPPLDDEFSSKKSSGKKKKHLPPLKPAVRRVDETLSDECRAMLLSTLILLLSNHFLSADSTPSIVAVNENDVFNFDFTWRPLRPMANETVHFRAIGTGQSVMQRWSLTNTSFRWYRQLPSADFRLVHVGRRYSRRASGYFEGRYRLSVRVNGQPQPESDYQPTSWSRVDIVKYIGLQRRIHSALIVKNRTTEHGRGRRIVCRFWGYPQVESLEFRPPTSPHSPAVCRTMSGHFETIETEPYIDLVSDCSTDTLLRLRVQLLRKKFCWRGTTQVSSG